MSTNYDSYGTPTRPDPNCRTCTDFKFWSKQQRQIFHNAGSEGKRSSSNDSGYQKGRKDCPMDKSSLGHATWGLLHTIAAYYPENPTYEQKKNVKSFFEVLSRVYPCEYCAEDYRKDLKTYPIKVDSQNALSQWLCQFHNRVNAKLGKPMFDCSKVNQRWRDGWLDGSCD